MDGSVSAITPHADDDVVGVEETFAVARRLGDALRRVNAHVIQPCCSENHRREMVVWRAMREAGMTGRRGQMQRKAEVMAAVALDAMLDHPDEKLVVAGATIASADAWLNAAPSVWRSLWKGVAS